MMHRREPGGGGAERTREQTFTWWHVERRGSWEGRARQTAAIHLAHAVRLNPTLFSAVRYPTLSPFCLLARLSCQRHCRARWPPPPPPPLSSLFRVHVCTMHFRCKTWSAVIRFVVGAIAFSYQSSAIAIGKRIAVIRTEFVRKF